MRHKKDTSSPPPPAASTSAVTAVPQIPRNGKSHRAMRPTGADPAATTVVVLRLYIANNAPNSVQAVANLEAICKEYLQNAFKLEVIDVLEYPERALADGILVTPSLAKVAPTPTMRVIGNLSNKASVLRALGIRGQIQ